MAVDVENSHQPGNGELKLEVRVRTHPAETSSSIVPKKLKKLAHSATFELLDLNHRAFWSTSHKDGDAYDDHTWRTPRLKQQLYAAAPQATGGGNQEGEGAEN